MNSDTISPQNDMGRDGLSVNGAKFQPKDVLGYVIHYYNRDYKPITKGPFEQDSTGISKFATASPNLYNGNIRAISQHNLQLGRSIGYAYGYDQLHRLATMDAWKATATQTLWQTTTASADYQERVSYDANGNITKYKRNKDSGVTQDSLNYKYNAGTNQLQYITDNVATNVLTTDIDNQSPNNYIYDKSGNMVADNSQSMAVSWSPYGKILTNTKAGGASLAFGYNAMQQRVIKRVSQSGDTTRTYYIRDAQGNTMGVYTRHNDSVSWREQYIFGSSRLGLYRADTLVNKGLTSISKLYEGKRNYELSNHLGNVMVVINDRKTDSLSGTTKVGYNAVVISATDYYPFGMAIDSRSYTSSLYRYGFNGKELDKETGEEDYGSRMYSIWGNRFLSIDPLAYQYPALSTYQFAGNNPIVATDLDGLEADVKNTGPSIVTQGIATAEEVARDIYELKSNYLKYFYNKLAPKITTFGLRAASLTVGLVLMPADNAKQPTCELCYTFNVEKPATPAEKYQPNYEEIVSDHSNLSPEYLKGVRDRVNGGKTNLNDYIYLLEANNRSKSDEKTPNSSLEETHITYVAVDKSSGLPYIGYASGKGTARDVLNRRYSSDFSRFTSTPKIVYSGEGNDSKNIARGLEQRLVEAAGGLAKTANVNNPVGPRNPKGKKEYLPAVDNFLKTLTK